MTEGRFVWNMINTLVIIFLGLAVFVAGTVIGSELINSEDSAVIPFGFGIYLIVGIVEILFGWSLYKTWKVNSR